MHKKVKEVFNLEGIDYVIALVLTGVTAGCFAYFLHLAIEFGVHLLKTDAPFTIRTTCYVLAVTLFSLFLTKKYFPETRGSGIPQVKLALVAKRGLIAKRFGFAKIVVSYLTLISGLSFGPEGPMVSVSSAFGYLYSAIFNLSLEHRKLLVKAGASAGLSAAFFAPITGVAFTIEEISQRLDTKIITPLVIASCIATATAYELFGHNKMAFPFENYMFNNKVNLIYYTFLGLIIGILGVVWINLSIRIKKFKRKYLKDSVYIYLVFVVLLIALGSQINSDFLGIGDDVIGKFIEGNSITLGLLFTIFIFKFFASSFSYGTGLSGGLFLPILFIGASAGLLIGKILVLWHVPNIEPGAFALLGMTSMLVSVMRTPFTAFLMLFETTRDYDLILPLMISSVVSYFIAEIILEGSIYEIVAEYEGVHLPSGKDQETLSSMQIEECLQSNVLAIDANSTPIDVKKIEDKLIFSGYPVLKNDNLYGLISFNDLSNFMNGNINTGVETNEKIDLVIEDQVLGNYCNKDVITAYPDQSFLVALEKMKRFNVSRLPVVSRFNTKRLVGIVTAKDIVDFFGLSKTAE